MRWLDAEDPAVASGCVAAGLLPPSSGTPPGGLLGEWTPPFGLLLPPSAVTITQGAGGRPSNDAVAVVAVEGCERAGWLVGRYLLLRPLPLLLRRRCDLIEEID